MCFGMTTTQQQTTSPSPLTQAAGLDTYGFAKSLADNPFSAPLQGTAPFNPTQGTAFANIFNLATTPNSNNPFYNREANAFSAYGSAPAGKVFAPSVLGGNVNPFSASLGDYVDPALGFELNPTLANITRQGEIAKNGPGGVGSSATGAGAYGDARQGVENANVDEAAMRQAALATGQAYQDAFKNAAALRGTDISNLTGAQTTNAQLNEQMLNRVLGAGNALQNLASYTTGTGLGLNQALLATGNQQQQNAQQQANAIYSQALQNVLGPYQYQLPALTSALNAMRPSEPSTTTTQQPNNAGWNLLGTILGSGFSGFGQGMGQNVGKGFGANLFGSPSTLFGGAPTAATTTGGDLMDAALPFV